MPLSLLPSGEPDAAASPPPTRPPADSLSVPALLMLAGVLVLASAALDVRAAGGGLPAEPAGRLAVAPVVRPAGAAGGGEACRVTAASPHVSADDRGASTRRSSLPARCCAEGRRPAPRCASPGI